MHMFSRPPSVTAIIPTFADSARRDSLMRAVCSLIGSTQRARLTITAVVNGNQHRPQILDELKALGVKIIRVAEASLPLAILEGRRAVTSDYFCFLDDDDEYLPEAIDIRLAAFEREPGTALVVSNGYRRIDDIDKVLLEHLPEVPDHPLNALFEENWLASCGGLFRTREVGVEFFERTQEYLEWTLLAFRLALSGKVVSVIDQPTFRIHDSPSSQSKSPATLTSRTALYRRMLCETLPSDIRRTIRLRLGTALSMQSVASLKDDDLPASWKYHLQTLGCPGGWRYGGQTLRLLAATIRRPLVIRKHT
jgi:hypothetical protein